MSCKTNEAGLFGFFASATRASRRFTIAVTCVDISEGAVAEAPVVAGTVGAAGLVGMTGVHPTSVTATTTAAKEHLTGPEDVPPLPFTVEG
jgi:hypothetical protein